VRVCRQTEVAREAPWAEVLIPAMARINRRHHPLCPDLRLIQQFGVGLEGVDRGEAANRGIGWPMFPDVEALCMPSALRRAAFFDDGLCPRYSLCRKMLTEGLWGRPQARRSLAGPP